MSNVYANGNAIACKAGGGKVIAAFPDVCMSPPPPPAGPIPIPYPDTSFSKDMKKGSKKVFIGNKEVMLKDQSFYKSSPLGNEAATRSFGANILTHVTTGKTYFGAWSMDVKFEGKNVPRHIDLTTCNHGSYPGGSGPMINAEKLAISRVNENKCPCCGKDDHGTSGVAMNVDEWYLAHNPGKEMYVSRLLERAKLKVGCHCVKNNTRILPEPPCNVFFGKYPNGSNEIKNQRKQIKDAWGKERRSYQTRNGIPRDPGVVKKLAIEQFELDTGKKPNRKELKLAKRRIRQANHLTPKSAGGCPNHQGNLQPHFKLCTACRKIDAEFSKYQ